MHQAFFQDLSIFVFLAVFSGCSGGGTWNKTLPSTTTLTPTRGYQEVRASIHLHSPISYDACDAGNNHCLSDLRAALCNNEIDFAFITDHPNNMANTTFSNLLLSVSGDQALTASDGTIIGNAITCSDAHQIQVMAGYEDQFMPIGMTNHLDPGASTLGSIYTGNSPALVARLQNESNAIVIIPHTESRSSSFLSNLGVNGIEIYNLHANINPTMRHNYLEFDYFSGLIDLTVYWIDPYGKQEPDLAFMSFLKVSPVYATKWNLLIAANQHVVGVAGNDSHQNFFSGTANDGDRVDSHRRLTRWITNHFLVTALTTDAIKSAIKQARGWVVFEGLGTPVNLDFHAQTNSTFAEVGGTMTLSPGNTTLHVQVPQLHSASPRGTGCAEPMMTLRLKMVDSTGTESVVASALGQSIDFIPQTAGAYRAEIGMIPLHLKSFMGYKNSQSTQEIPWVITNHIYIQ